MSETYDYVIVGAGAAGAVLAARLTERSTARVLLLEAGRDVRWSETPDELRRTNPAALLGEDMSEHRWVDLVARRTAAQAPYLFVRGRAMGGSTAINGMFAVRPEPGDLDDWAKDGCTGWSWDDTLPWFRHLEDDLDFGDRAYHGRGGPYPIWRPPVDGWGCVDLAARDATLEAGLPWCDDHNAPESTGVAAAAASVRDGVRVCTSNAYLEPARDRPNLAVIGGALVDRVIFDRDRAVGVELVRNGARAVVHGGEIVLAAGAVHSPAILLRSGIGDPEQLRELGIDVTVSLAGVGANLADHAALAIGMLGPSDDSWSAPNGRHGSCYARWSSGLDGTGPNDLAFFAATYPANLIPGIPSALAVNTAVWQPFSRGSLRLASRDATVDPVIEENMLSDERDRVRMRQGVRFVLELVRHDSFRALGDTLLAGGMNGMELIPPHPTDGDIDRLAMAYARDTEHIVGTCRMGEPDDPATVVDPHGRVLGVEALRVIDASVMPTCPRANTALTTIMIAEKLAAELRG